MLLYDYVYESEKVNSISKVSSKLSQIQLQDRPVLKVLAKCENDSKDFEPVVTIAKTLLNFPLLSETDNNYENATVYYLNLIKILVREISAEILNKLFDTKNGEFPILRSLLEYSHHCDGMVKNVARLAVLTILKKSQGEVLEYVVEYVIPDHLSKIITFLKRIIIDFDATIKNGNLKLCNHMCVMYEEELEYVNDIIGMQHKFISDFSKYIFLDNFIFQVIFRMISGKYSQNKTMEIGLFLLGKLMKTTSNIELNENIIDCLIPLNIEEKSINSKLTQNIITRIRKTIKIRCSETDLSSLYILGILNLVIKSLNNLGDMKGILTFYKCYAKLLMQQFLRENVTYSELDIIKLDLSASMLSAIAVLTAENLHCLTLRNDFYMKLKKLYLNLCQKLNYNNMQKFSSNVDGTYETFLQGHEVDIFSKYYFPNKYIELNKPKYPGTEYKLLTLFYLRSICLQFSHKTEKILPLLSEKNKIGHMTSANNCIFCEVVGRGNADVENHAVKLTSSQFLVLQNTKDKQGTVIFSSYYKSLKWIEYKKNCLMLWSIENSKNSKLEKHQSNSSTILLEFKATSDRDIMIEILPKIKSKQCDIIQKKLNDLLEVDVRKKHITI